MKTKLPKVHGDKREYVTRAITENIVAGKLKSGIASSPKNWPIGSESV